ncbi:MAG: DNA polymerase I [Proteobacteria bacterium]|nr:MAG: DNA polymerase I [Pseudomonadota bacterium]
MHDAPRAPARDSGAASREGGERAPRLVVVDAANCLYRAFFAIPPLRASDGTPTNAAYGFLNMLIKALREEQPDHVVVVFDAPGGGASRREIFGEYKAHRDAQPEDLSRQIPLVRELVDAHHIPLLEVPGCEADDVIATLVARAPADARITILSTDKDLMQLVTERVALLDTMKDRRYGPAEVEERFGVPPARVLDLRALVGDPSDNIPGVKGIGEKGAAKLLAEYGTLEALLERADEIPATKTRNVLREQAEQARLSKRLAALHDDVALPVCFDDLVRREPDRERLRQLFRRLEFTRLLAELDGPAAAPRAPAAGTVETAVETEIVRDAAALARLVEQLAALAEVVAVPIGAGEPAIREAPVGIAFATGPGRAAYVPFAHAGLASHPQLAREVVVERLGRVLRERRWGGARTKALVACLGEWGHEPASPAWDVEIAAFLLDPAAARGVAALAAQHLGRRLRSWEDLCGRGAKAVAAADLAIEAAGEWAGAHACAVAELAPLLVEHLARDGIDALFRDVEMPLVAVLARMERAGVRVDDGALRALSREYERELARIEAEIHSLAGGPFQIGSPKQLQAVLFERLKLPVVRKTKTGFSTDEAVLEQLASQHPLPARILAYRRLAKLKSTYVDALPPLVDPKSGRIHPCFHQTGAATGRLSASNPNVQNIPIRSEEGVRIREAFVAREGALLLSADYSQVELRILAHFSRDAELLEAFRSGEDVHRRTAAGVLGIAPEAVTADQRARAKAINFGIIYGSTAFGIANQLGIASADAQQTIDAYFARYAGVRAFLDLTLETARSQGWVTTLLGRRRYLPDLQSRNRVLRNAAERMAVNTVIQGTAADLIKKAMVDVDRALQGAGVRAQMILQVHDELVFEVAADDVDAAGRLVREPMEQVWPLDVPLLVEMGVGRNWREAH